MDNFDLQRSGIPLDAGQTEQFAAYARLLSQWNEKMDLTSVDSADTVRRHFLDSLLPLSAEGLIPREGKIIDVGSGAGFPGLPLAIALPTVQFTLLEAQGKRCQFLREVKARLRLDNVQIVQNRAEVLGQDDAHRERYDRALARAVAPLNLLSEYLLPFVRVGGCALCWKGPAVFEEMADGRAAAALLGGRVETPVEMPLDGARHILVPIPKIEKTLPQYPRKNGIPAKRPLKESKK